MKKIAVFALIVLLGGCTPPDIYIRLNSYLSRGDINAAIAEIEADKTKLYPKKNALLYFLDFGLLNHLAGNYKTSNKSFEKAKRLADEYFTKSISKEATTLLINEATRPYYGEDFERALIYLFKALNYACMEKDEDALVEARQLNHFLKTLETKYGHKNRYKEDAFARYISAMLYESAGNFNDALIEYKKSIRAFEKYRGFFGPPPADLIRSAIACSTKLGIYEDAQWLRKKYKLKGKLNRTEIVLIHLNGPAPEKINHFIEISFGDGWAYVENVKARGKEASNIEEARAAGRAISAKKTFRVAFPQYIQPEYACAGAEIEVAGKKGKWRTRKISDIFSIARKTLKDRIARIKARAIARAWIKAVLAKKAEEKTAKRRGELTGLLVGGALRAIGSATETADLRRWGTLPAEIDVARIPVKPGKHSLRIYFKDKNGNIISQKVLNDISVRKNKKTFVTVRTLL
ncbi:MAG: hypothetical protein J7L54_05410 [Elusimicrobia bacterium]|nr:hypothetical protein [Elusimicrobiota bacterium]